MIFMGQTKNPSAGKVLYFLVFLCFLLVPEIIFAQIQAPSRLQRTETSTGSPFFRFRERSSQSLVYNHWSPYIVSEFEFQHTTFKYVLGDKPDTNWIYHASVTGQNMSTPLTFKAGRIWTGNELFQPVDGVSWRYPWGNRLTTSLSLGRVSQTNLDWPERHPAFAEGKLRYKLNDSAFFAIQSAQEMKDNYTSAMLGYSIDSLKSLAEFKSTGATDTFRISLQYYDGYRCDLTSDYRVEMNNGRNSGLLRNTLGISGKKLYFETGVGKKFLFGRTAGPQNFYYDGTLSYGIGKKDQDNVSVGYLVESATASEARTLSGNLERVISANTRLGISVADTRINDGPTSIQHIESYLNRKVDWGFFEVMFALVTTGSNPDLQKEVRLRAGYDY